MYTEYLNDEVMDEFEMISNEIEIENCYNENYFKENNRRTNTEEVDTETIVSISKYSECNVNITEHDNFHQSND